MLNVAAINNSLKRIWVFNLTLILFLIISASLWTACRKSPEVVKIGLIGPFTGRNRPIGYDAIYGARLAIREINESGETGNYRLALVAIDDFGDPEMAKLNALTLSYDPDVMIVMGHWLPDTTKSAIPIYESSGITLIETGTGPFGPQDPSSLPDSFWEKYTELTPFDEVPGPFAASAYDAITLINAGMNKVIMNENSVTRSSLGSALEKEVIDGLNGQIFLRGRR
jgi:ABC-type branched-subunit amino acid transport system substrate-binding protein